MTLDTAASIVKDFDADPVAVRARAVAEARAMGLPEPTPALKPEFPCHPKARSIEAHLEQAEDA